MKFLLILILTVNGHVVETPGGKFDTLVECTRNGEAIKSMFVVKRQLGEVSTPPDYRCTLPSQWEHQWDNPPPN